MRIGDLLDGEYLVDEIVMISHALKKSRAWVLSHLDEKVPPEKLHEILRMIEQRKMGKPLHYIIGEREFMGFVFEVDEGVFIPRPETETLVEIALSKIEKGDIEVVAEIGVGSGVIGVSIAKIARVRVLGSDVNRKAVDLALRNAKRLGVEDLVDFRVGEFLEPFRERVDEIDFVVSNPPYVEIGYAPPPEVRHEPEDAIFAGEDGLDFYRGYFGRYERMFDTLMEFSGKEGAKEFLKGVCPEVVFYEDLDGVERFFFCPSEPH